jgi:hypothetical protein
MLERLFPDETNRPPESAVDKCPCCHTPLSPGKPVGHWDGDRTAGFLYAAECPGCEKRLVGTGKAGGEPPEEVTWTKAE